MRDALLAAGVPVLAGHGAPVVTSARREARAPAGFAAAIRARPAPEATSSARPAPEATGSALCA
jgi:hypothetical protein